MRRLLLFTLPAGLLTALGSAWIPAALAPHADIVRGLSGGSTPVFTGVHAYVASNCIITVGRTARWYSTAFDWETTCHPLESPEFLGKLAAQLRTAPVEWGTPVTPEESTRLARPPFMCAPDPAEGHQHRVELYLGFPFRSFGSTLVQAPARPPGGESLRWGVVVWPSSIPAGSTGHLSGARILPLRPSWPGLTADAVVWALAWWVAGMCFGVWREHRRKAFALREGFCPKCRYPRAGLDAAAPCPECGVVSHA